MKFAFAPAMGGALLSAFVLGAACTTFAGPAAAATACGGASWYAMTSRTASGERANPNTLTAAHRTLPFGTKVTVENLRNRRKVTVRINDRGPFVRGRIIDVSRAAAHRLDMVRSGTAPVRISAGGDRRLGSNC